MTKDERVDDFFDWLMRSDSVNTESWDAAKIWRGSGSDVERG